MKTPRRAPVCRRTGRRDLLVARFPFSFDEEKGLPAKKGKSGDGDEEDEEDGAVAAARAKLAAGKAKPKKEPEKPKKGKEARHWDGGKASKALMEDCRPLRSSVF